MKKRYLSLLLLLLALPLAMLAKPTADAVLKSAATGVSSAMGISASFTASSSEGQFSGVLKASGRKFYIAAGKNKIWYNGSHMWTYNGSSNETTREVPSAAELAETNPLLFVTSNYKRYKASYASSQTPGCHTLILTPFGGASLPKATLTVDASTYAPKKVVVKVDKTNVTVTINSFSKASVPESTFDFSKTSYAKGKVTNLN